MTIPNYETPDTYGGLSSNIFLKLHELASANSLSTKTLEEFKESNSALHSIRGLNLQIDSIELTLDSSKSERITISPYLVSTLFDKAVSDRIFNKGDKSTAVRVAKIIYGTGVAKQVELRAITEQDSKTIKGYTLHVKLLQKDRESAIRQIEIVRDILDSKYEIDIDLLIRAFYGCQFN